MPAEHTRGHTLEDILGQARGKEGEYNWLEATKLYEQTFNLESDSSFFVANTWERVGFCYGRASTQAENLEDFIRLRQLAVEAYKNAAALFEKEDDLKAKGKSLQCSAIAEYTRSWLASNPSEKKEMLNESLRLGKESLEAYKSADDDLNFAKMCNDLLLCLFEKQYIASDWNEMVSVAQEGINYANKGLEVLLRLGDKRELLRAYSTASLLGWYAANISEQENERKELVQKSLSYSEKARELSRQVDDAYHAAMANWAGTFCTLLFTEKADASLEYAKEMLKLGTALRDNYLKGVASYLLSFVTDWTTLREADPDRKKEGYERIIEYAKDAARYLQPISQDLFIAQAYLFYAESHSSLARDAEASPGERRAISKKAVEIGREGLEHANLSGSSDAMVSTLHALSKALHFYSNFEDKKDEKAKLLQEALAYRQTYHKIAEKIVPTNDWVQGVGENYEGLIKVELFKIETDENRRKSLLESAVADMEEGVSRCKRWILSRPIPTLIAAVGAFEDGFGGTLNELYLLTKDEKILNRAIEIYDDAAREFKKVNLPSRVAEAYWKVAKGQDCLGKNQKASENFANAFEEYKVAAQRIPHFADFYLDYATYMNAWSEIEKAKSAHKHEEYADAMKHYDKVASLLKPSRPWGYFASNFSAWSLLERAEDLSRKENCSESIEAFKNAVVLFKEAKESFEDEIDKIQNLDEKEKAIELSGASSRRRDYCLARVNVEEARVYDRKGDYAKSAEEYESAAATFEKILETTETESDRNELQTIIFTCCAWQKMKLADGRASPELYSQASDLFLKARECSAKSRTALLASGNSAFCKALEYGTRFEETREREDFTKAKNYLESAANHYLKASFENASSWASATEILFDAYNYTITAETETDPEKKMKTYLLAEKCLERSAKLYDSAGYVGKKEEVYRTLEKVKEKREFALSLGDLLTVPVDASTTSVISTPIMSVEEPVGLLKFERAFVQVNLIARQREVVVGEDFGLEVQIANLGKNVAFLLKLEEIVPEGFDIIEKPEKCTCDDSFLSFRGKKLAPLETGEIKLKLKPRKKGRFVFKPRIQFMDEAGEYKSNELEQFTVTVKELGIRGWLRGPS